MKSCLIKKEIAVGIIIIFAVTSIIPSISGNTRKSIDAIGKDNFYSLLEDWIPEKLIEAAEDKI